MRTDIHWIEARIGQIGIDVRQSKEHANMRLYLELLRQEILMTEEFLSEDGEDTQAGRLQGQ